MKITQQIKMNNISQLIKFFTFLFIGGFLFVNQASAQSAVDISFETTPLFENLNILPGDETSKWVKVKNNSDEVQAVAVAVDYFEDFDGLGSQMKMVISSGGDYFYEDSLSDFFNAGEIYLSDISSGIEKQYDFAVSFIFDTDNTYQGKTLNFNIIVGTQIEEQESGSERSGGSSTGGGGYVYKSSIVSIFDDDILVLGEEGLPRLVVNKDCKQGIVNPGDKVVCEVKIENLGSLTAYNVVLRDKLSEGLKFIDASVNEKLWNLGNIGPSDFNSVEYLVVVGEGTENGVYSNFAYVSADNSEEIGASANLEVKNVKVLGAELEHTGFSNKEFIFIVLFLLTSLAISQFLRKKYF